jgi:hypothetical protein
LPSTCYGKCHHSWHWHSFMCSSTNHLGIENSHKAQFCRHVLRPLMELRLVGSRRNTVAGSRPGRAAALRAMFAFN